MSRSEKRPARPGGGPDVVSAWIIVAMLLLGLVLVPAFESAITDGVQLIAELH